MARKATLFLMAAANSGVVGTVTSTRTVTAQTEFTLAGTG